MQDVSTFNIRRIKIDMMNYCMHIASACAHTVGRTRRKLLLCSALILRRRRYIDNWNYVFFFSELEFFNFVTFTKQNPFQNKRKTCQLWFWFLVLRAGENKYLQQNIPVFPSSGIHKHRIQFFVFLVSIASTAVRNPNWIQLLPLTDSIVRLPRNLLQRISFVHLCIDSSVKNSKENWLVLRFELAFRKWSPVQRRCILRRNHFMHQWMWALEPSQAHL